MKYRLVYAGANFFAPVLEALLARPDIEVVLCLTGDRYSPHSSNVARIAKTHSIPFVDGEFTPELIRRIRTLKPDIILCAAYSHRVPVADLGIKYNLNLHPALLPQGRGPNPLPYLTSQYPQFSGLTLHEMTARFDEGDILDQEPVPVQEGWGHNELAMAFFLHAPKFVNGIFDKLDVLFTNKKPQGEGSYWPGPSREDRTVSWSEPASTIAGRSRMFGALGVLCPIDGVEHNIVHPVAYIDATHEFEYGRVIHRSGAMMYIAASGGIVRIQTGGGGFSWLKLLQRVRSGALRMVKATRELALHPADANSWRQIRSLAHSFHTGLCSGMSRRVSPPVRSRSR